MSPHRHIVARRVAPGAFALALVLALPAPGLAQNQAAEKERSTEQMASDIASQPAEDIGIEKKEIPEVLLKVQDAPYSLKDIRSCTDIRTAVAELDTALGEDLDVKDDKTREQKRKETAGAVGGAIVNSFVPFRGIIREVSGAGARQRRYNEAIYAGVVRRSFLKGLGQQKGCRYPAAPETVQ